MDAQAMIERSREGLEAWNRHDAEGVVAVLTEDAVMMDVAMPEPLRGRDAIRQVVEAYLTGVPDLEVEIKSQVAGEDRLIEEWHAHGHHRGELMGVAPTGREVDFDGCAILFFDSDGREREIHQYWGVNQLMQQIGAVGEPAHA